MFDRALTQRPWVAAAGLYRPRRADRPGASLHDVLAGLIRSAADLLGAEGHSAWLKMASTAWRDANGAAPTANAIAAATDMLKGRAVDLCNPLERREALGLAAATTVLARGRAHIACFSDGLAEVAHDAAATTFDHLKLDHAVIGRRDDMAARRAAYASPIVYVSARRLAQDALLDADALSGAVSPTRARVRRLARAEADTAPILGRGAAAAFVDDADLTLLVAGSPASLVADPKAQEGRRLAEEAFSIVSAMSQPDHYQIDPLTRRIQLTDGGERRCASFALAFGGPWAAASWRAETILAALAIRDLYEFGRNYSLEDGRIVVQGGGATAGALPSIPDLIAAKEGMDHTAPGAQQISLPRYFGRYLHLGAVGVELHSLRREVKEAVGLRVRRCGPVAASLQVEAFPDFEGKVAHLRRLAHDDWVLWAPTEGDAARLGEVDAKVIIGADLFEATASNARVLQAAAASPQVEIRFAALHPNSRAVVSAEDQYFEPLEAQLLTHIQKGESAMSEQSYRRLQVLREDYAAEQRTKQVRADAYFDAVMAFAGEER